MAEGSQQNKLLIMVFLALVVGLGAAFLWMTTHGQETPTPRITNVFQDAGDRR